MTKKEDSGKNPLSILKRKLSVTRITVIVLIVAIIVGGITASYIALRPGAPPTSPTATASPSPTSSPSPTTSSTPTPTPSPTATASPSPTSSPSPTTSSTPTPTLSPTPIPTTTPTPTPTPEPGLTHTVDSTAIANGQADYWNLSITSPYTAVLNDTMTGSSGSQLEIDAEWNLSSFTPMWTVLFLNSTSFNFFVYYTNGTVAGAGYSLPCINGGVQVVVTQTQITFNGTTSTTVTVPFEDLLQIASFANSGDFTSGELNITLTQP